MTGQIQATNFNYVCLKSNANSTCLIPGCVHICEEIDIFRNRKATIKFSSQPSRIVNFLICTACAMQILYFHPVNSISSSCTGRKSTIKSRLLAQLGGSFSGGPGGKIAIFSLFLFFHGKDCKKKNRIRFRLSVMASVQYEYF